MKEDESKTSFSDLPPELRNTIYEYALCPANGQAFPFRHYPKVAELDTIAFNLLNTCYAIRKEANAIFYSRNTFRIDLLHVPETAQDFDTLRSQHLSKDAEDREAQREARREIDDLRQQLEKPLLSQALKAIAAKNLSLVNSFKFAYHVRQPRSRKSFRTVNLSRIPKFTVKLQLQEKGFDLALCQRVKDDAFRASWEDVTAPHFASIIGARGLRALAKNDVLMLANMIIRKS